jgi:hypothetical protein
MRLFYPIILGSLPYDLSKRLKSRLAANSDSALSQ